MSATLELDEYNGGGVRTHGVVNLNVGSIDSPNIVVSPTSAIQVGTNSFAKYNQLHFTSLGGATVSGITVWMSQGAVVSGETLVTNLGGASNYFTVPLAVPTRQTIGGNMMPTAAPTGPNLGIGGSLVGTLSAPGVSDIWQWQLQLSKTVPRGTLATKEYSVSWIES
jgi:hypothetical protein